MGKMWWSTPTGKDRPSGTRAKHPSTMAGRTALAYDDLRDWIRTLEKNGELKRIRQEVSPDLEITEITDRVSKIGKTANRVATPSIEGKYAPGGPALLFENVKGFPGRAVLINQFGSERRMAMALGVERLEQIAERIKGLMNVKPPGGGFLEKLKMLPQLAELGGDGEGCAVQGSDSARPV
jgi:4-hydroxy-3-polyprenylbenzoate decarboxylase